MLLYKDSISLPVQNPSEDEILRVGMSDRSYESNSVLLILYQSSESFAPLLYIVVFIPISQRGVKLFLKTISTKDASADPFVIEQEWLAK